MTYIASETDLAYLREHLTGSVVTPDDQRYDEAREAWNLVFDQHPALVVLPETAEDIAATVRFARANGLRVAPQGTGHNPGALVNDMSATILLRTSRMRRVTIDPVGLRARAEAGAIWEEVVEPAAAYGLSVLHGSSPDVGVVGYSLGGGIGWQVRLHGLATNSITAIELVTADGEQIRADATTEPELFWAMRGGGGNFGIVTALELQLFPLKTAYAGWLIWPWEQSHAVLSRWAEWTRTVPEEMTSVGRILRLPVLPMIPEPLRGRDLVVVVETAYVGADDRGAKLIRPLRELRPEMDTVETVPATALARLHQDPEGATPAFVEHFMLDSLGRDVVDAFVDAVGPDSGSPILSTEIRHLGGATGMPAPGGGALSHFESEYLTVAVSIPGDDKLNAAIKRQFGIYADAMRPFGSGRQYLNLVEHETDTRTFYPARTHRRLATIRAKADPTGLLHANHEIQAG